jgi:hypothetical protein
MHFYLAVTSNELHGFHITLQGADAVLVDDPMLKLDLPCLAFVPAVVQRPAGQL